MKTIIRLVGLLILSVVYFPFLLFYWLIPIRIKEDIHSYSKHFKFLFNYTFTIVYLLYKIPEFRSLFYFRYPHSQFLKKIYGGVQSLYFFMKPDSIGGGLIIWHGYSTSVNAIKIGSHCEIWQNVTIGKKTTLKIADKPTIGNNVKICANSVVIGSIKIGNNVTIGAGSVVTKDIPDNSIVVGNPARIIKTVK